MKEPKVELITTSDDGVNFQPGWYQVGGWSFDEEDRDLAYIDQAIAAWTTWRAWVVSHGEWEGKSR